MKLFFIALKLNFESGGGSAWELDAKIRSLIKQGHSAIVITLFSGQNRLQSGLPYKVVEEQIASLSLWNIQHGVLRMLKKYQAEADLFQVEGQFAYGSGLYRLLGGRKPVIVHFNRELSSFPESTRKNSNKFGSLKKLFRFWLERSVGFPLINRNDLLTFTSPILLDLYASFGVNKIKSSVIPDFFDSNEFRNPARLSESTAGKNGGDEFSVFCTGRMVWEKGFDVLLKAVDILVKRGERYRLLLSGDGPEKQALQNLSAQLGISEHVAFLGWLEKPALIKEMAKADVIVIPRWRPELTSMIALEALALGVPAIVPVNSALSWQMQNSALTFEDENFHELADQIKKMRDNPALQTDLKVAGQIRLGELDLPVSLSKLMTAIAQVTK